jgi:NADP-dependent 3-hydroxy acid dehydrogenase YdfG
VSALASLRQTFPNAKILEKVVDITSEEAVNLGVAETVSDLGSVDILLCFAGVVGTVHAAELPLQQWRRMLDINTTGSWICAEAVGKCVTVLFLLSLRDLRSTLSPRAPGR